MYKKKFVAKNGTEVLFREPKKTDAKIAMNFINKIIEEPKNGILFNKKINLKGEKAWLNGVIKEVKSKERVALFVICNNKMEGNCSIDRKKFKEDHRAVLGIALSKDLREKGVGTALMKEIMLLAKKRIKGITMIELFVKDYNKRAQHVYKKMGFKKICTIPKAARENGKYIDEYLMHLYLK